MSKFNSPGRQKIPQHLKRKQFTITLSPQAATIVESEITRAGSPFHSNKSAFFEHIVLKSAGQGSQ